MLPPGRQKQVLEEIGISRQDSRTYATKLESLAGKRQKHFQIVISAADITYTGNLFVRLADASRRHPCQLAEQILKAFL
jgi:hypothetical protein